MSKYITLKCAFFYPVNKIHVVDGNTKARLRFVDSQADFASDANCRNFTPRTNYNKLNLLIKRSLVAIFNLHYTCNELFFCFISVRRNNGSCPSHWRRGSGSIARKGLQALEQLKLVEKDANGGRKMSSQGRRDLDRIAAQIKQAKKA